MASYEPNPGLAAELKEELLPDLLQIGAEIAARVPGRVRIHRYGGPQIEVGEVDGKVVVARMEPWAAIDEFGGNHLEPTAALRNAARAQPGVFFEGL